MNQALRSGNFTSSEIYKLMTRSTNKKDFGKPALTYILDKRIERRLGRTLEQESYSRSMAWGIFLEQRVLDLLGLEYQLISDETKQHPTIEGWSGSQDLLVKGQKISDIKCYQPKNFIEYTDVLVKQDVELLKSEFPKEYWQLVSNAIINNVPNAEAISYMPFQSELAIIKEMAMNFEGDDPWKYRFIYEEKDDNLPYIPDGNLYYTNLNKFEFEVPKQDIEDLTDSVIRALKLLNQK